MLHPSLISELIASGYMTRDAPWCQGHGAVEGSYKLGFGLVYYALVQALSCELCVVLGSGGGFVPRMMRQAQLDFGIEGRTVLVDGDMGNWGRPQWMAEDSFFRTEWPDIEWLKMSTEEAVDHFAEESIGFLYIDADHSRAYEDYVLYFRKVAIGGMIGIHDIATKCGAGPAFAKVRFSGVEAIEFADIGAGVGLLRRWE